MNYETPSEWVNYGDVNPERHGGIFVKWDNDMWHIIETTHFADLPKGMSDNEHMFTHMFMEPMDIWTNGNPTKGFTERAMKELQSFNNMGFDPLNPGEIPEGESYQEYVEWYMDSYMRRLVGNLAFAFTQYIHGDTDYSEDYWGYLEHYGIEESNF
jgi:hypothetical protein